MASERTDAPGTASSGTGDGPRDAARETIDTVKQEASGLAGRASEQGRSMLSRQKEAAADHLDSVAKALRGSARGLEQEEPAAGRYVGYAAERLQSMGRQLRDRDVDGLLDDVQDLGRRAPGAFFAGSVIAGFLMARFLKSSADRAAGGTTTWRDASSRGAAGRGMRSGDDGFADEDLRSARGGASGAGGYGGRSPGTGAAPSARAVSGESHGR